MFDKVFNGTPGLFDLFDTQEPALRDSRKKKSAGQSRPKQGSRNDSNTNPARPRSVSDNPRKGGENNMPKPVDIPARRPAPQSAPQMANPRQPLSEPTPESESSVKPASPARPVINLPAADPKPADADAPRVPSLFDGSDDDLTPPEQPAPKSGKHTPGTSRESLPPRRSSDPYNFTDEDFAWANANVFKRMRNRIEEMRQNGECLQIAPSDYEADLLDPVSDLTFHMDNGNAHFANANFLEPGTLDYVVTIAQNLFGLEEPKPKAQLCAPFFYRYGGWRSIDEVEREEGRMITYSQLTAPDSMWKWFLTDRSGKPLCDKAGELPAGDIDIEAYLNDRYA